MSSKITITLVLGMLVMFFFMSSEVAAKDLKEDEVFGETNVLHGANLVTGGGFPGGGFPGGGFPGGGFTGGGFPGGGFPGGFPGGGFPGGGFPGGGFPGGGFPGGGFPGVGFPGGGGFGGFPPRFCRLGCCLRNAFTRQCFRCCP